MILLCRICGVGGIFLGLSLALLKMVVCFLLLQFCHARFNVILIFSVDECRYSMYVGQQYRTTEKLVGFVFIDTRRFGGVAFFALLDPPPPP